jgi:hypothetical protein
VQRAAAHRQVVPQVLGAGQRDLAAQAPLQRVLRLRPRAHAARAGSDLTIAHAWGGYTVEENQKWSLDYIAAMAKSKIVRSDELMQ